MAWWWDGPRVVLFVVCPPQLVRLGIHPSVTNAIRSLEHRTKTHFSFIVLLLRPPLLLFLFFILFYCFTICIRTIHCLYDTHRQRDQHILGLNILNTHTLTSTLDTAQSLCCSALLIIRENKKPFNNNNNKKRATFRRKSKRKGIFSSRERNISAIKVVSELSLPIRISSKYAYFSLSLMTISCPRDLCSFSRRYQHNIIPVFTDTDTAQHRSPVTESNYTPLLKLQASSAVIIHNAILLAARWPRAAELFNYQQREKKGWRIW